MSGLFGRTNAIQSSKLKGLSAQTSVYGAVLPLGYGRFRLSGNMIWYGDFTATKQKAQGGKGGMFGGGGKGGGVSYEYSAAVLLALCVGGSSLKLFNVYDSAGQVELTVTVETFTVPGGGGSHTVAHSGSTVFYGDHGVTRGDSYSVPTNDYGNPAGSGTLTGTQQTPMATVVASPEAGQYTVSSSGTYAFSAADAGKVMTITYAWAAPTAAGTSGQPITVAQLTFLKGTLGQSPWSYLSTNHPTEALGYTQVAAVASPKMDLGGSGALPNLSFEIGGLLPFGGGIVDSNPRDVIVDALTSTTYGVSFPAAEIGDLSNYSDFCVANGLFMSPVFDSDRPAADWLKDIIDATVSEAFISQGVLKIVPYGDTSAVAFGATYQPQTAPVVDLNDDDFLYDAGEDPVRITRPTIADVFTNVRVEYLERANRYNPTVVEEFDQNAIETYRPRQTSPTSMHFYTTQAASQQAANMILKRQIYVRNQYGFKIDMRYPYLEQMDLVTLTDTNLGLDKTPVRLLSISEDGNGKLDCVAEEFPWGTAAPTLYPKESPAPFVPASDNDPGNVNTPIMFEALSRLNNQIGHAIYMGVSGSDPDWGGCSVWVSTDGTTYEKVDTFFSKSRMGTLTATLASHADPDTTNTLSVDLTESSGELFSGSSADANAFRTLCYVGGATNELISYQDATLTSAFHYNLGTLLRRGVAGSPIGSHASGSPFLRLDDNVFSYDYDPTLIGTTLHFKFTSFNLVGQREQSLADVTDYTIAVTGASLGLLTPAHVTYRPTTNPLTAHDAGSNATINVASFPMRVPGITDINLNSGAITGLSYNTLYYVYYDDPNFFGGAVTYVATTTKETALNGAGRFFVGSITTPRAGGSDTTGNNDGGSGAQLGMVNVFGFQVTGSSASGGATISNSGNIVDGSDSSFCDLTINTGIGSNCFVLLGNASSVQRAFSSLKVKIAVQITQNNAAPNGTTSNSFFDVLYPDGVGGLASQRVLGPLVYNAGVVAFQVLEAVIPPTTNLSQIQVTLQNAVSSNITSGGIVLRVFGAWIEGIE